MPAKFLEKAIKFFVILTFFVPLLLAPSSFIFPFIVPKILLFRSLALLMFGIYILLLVNNWQRYKIHLNWMNSTVGFFLFSFTISVFAGVDWYKSFWDNHERMLGLFTILHFVIYYFVITSVIKGWSDWKWLLRIFLFAGMIVMIIGGMQKINPELLLNRGSGRVSATLGNAIYFSGYGLFLMFIGLLLALKEEVKKNNFWFWYAVTGSIFGFLGIFWGGTRGTLLGLIAGGLVFLLVYVLTIKEHKIIKTFVYGLLILFVITTGLFFSFRRTDFVARIPLVGRLFSTNLNESTTATRLMAWHIAIEAWEEKPIFGWGPNNYYYAFNKYYNPKFLEHGWGETWFDNAHSAIFNTIAVQGLVGIVSYFLLFITPAIVLIQGFRARRIDRHILAVSLAFLAGHFMHNATVFENPTSYLYFFFFLAFINSKSRHPDSPDLRIKNKDTGRVSVGLTAAVYILVLIVIYITNINPARANMATLKVIQTLYADTRLAESSYLKAIEIPSPHIDDIRNDVSRSITQLVPVLITKKQDKSATDLLELAINELNKNKELHPLDIRIHHQLAQLYPLYFQLTNNSLYLSKAENELEEALSISPKRQQTRYMLSFLKIQLGKTGEAIQIVQKSVEDDPLIGEGWARLALAYSTANDQKKALQIIEEARQRGISFSGQLEGIVNAIISKDSSSQ